MIPYLPVGACVSNMVNLLAAIALEPGKLENTRYGSFHQWFGSYSRRIAEKLNGALSCETIVRHHSSASMMGALLNACEEATFIEELTTNSVATGVFHKFHFTRPLASLRIRRCSVCVQSDLELWGVAHWRVHHQLLPITRCYIHKIPLEESCQQCGSDIWFCRHKGLIDLSACHRCGSGDYHQVRSAQTLAYESFEDLTERSLRGAAFELRPGYRLRMIRSMTAYARSTGIDLREMFLDFWGVDSTEGLYLQLGKSHTSCDITEILAGRRWISSPLIMIALIAFSKQFLDENAISISPEQNPPRKGCSNLLLNEDYLSVQRVVALARQLGIPDSRSRALIGSTGKRTLWSLSAERTVFQTLSRALDDRVAVTAPTAGVVHFAL